MSLKRELIYIDEKDETDRIAQYSYKGDKIGVVFKNGTKEFFYSRSRARIVRTAVTSDKAFNVFNYLQEIADTVGLKTEEGSNILSRSYQSIEQIPEDSILSSFLNGTLPTENNQYPNPDFFPFGFNLSQRNAVNLAFANNLNVIEGPPGTGKTQTILNIIANAVLNGQSVAVVSSNNSATKNVYEKLEKNGIEFIAALLGNSQNKKEFIDSQKEIPDLSKFHLSEEEKANFKILKIGDKYSQELVQKAFSTADLCGCYLQTKDHDIVFDDGTIVRLYSRSVLKTLELSNDCFVSDNTDFSHITWSIAPSAVIVKGYQVRPNKAYTK